MTRASYSCPACDRPGVERVDERLAAFKCAVCGEIVREETGVSA
jgi:ribosomal protein L37AE/L43A